MPPRRSSSARKCYVLTTDPELGDCLTDCIGRVWPLEKEKTYRPKEAALDPRMEGASAEEVRRLVRACDLYAFNRNARVILIPDCALTAYKAWRIGSNSHRSAPHLFQSRSLLSA